MVLEMIKKLGVIALIAVMGSMLFVIFFEPVEFEYLILPMPVVTEQPIKAGTTVFLRNRVCNYREEALDYAVYRELYNVDTHDVQPLNTGDRIAPVGCITRDSVPMDIPAKTCTGTYRLRGHARIELLVRTVRVKWYSTDFKVINNEC